MRRKIDVTKVILTAAVVLLAVTCFRLQSSVERLESQMTAIQDQQLTLSKDQLRLTEALANWLEMWQVDMFESSAYSPLDDRNGLSSWRDGEYMAAGVRTREHLDTAIAVDPAVIPLGSRVWVQGEGWKVALDTGGAVTGKRIDLPKWTFEEAVEYGRKNVMVLYPREADRM